MCIRVSTPLQNTLLFLAKRPPPKLVKQSKPPFLGNPPSILVFREPPPPSPKSQIFQWTPKLSLLNISDFNLFFIWKLHPPLPPPSSFTKNQYRGGIAYKGGLGQFCRFKREKEVVGVFEGGGAVLISRCTLWKQLSHLIRHSLMKKFFYII